MKPLHAAAAASFLGLLIAAGADTLRAQGYNPMAPGSAARNPLLPGGSAEPKGAEAEPNPELGNLPDTPGAEDTFYLCTACHSSAIIRQQRISDARWDYLWTWMVETQGMPEQDEQTKETILSYLKRHFSSQR